MAGHGLVFTNATGLGAAGTSGPPAAAYPPYYGPQSVPGNQQVIKVVGVSIISTDVTHPGAIVIRDGGSTGNPIAYASFPAATATVPSGVDLNLAVPRAANNGLWIEVDGSTAFTGTIWVV